MIFNKSRFAKIILLIALSNFMFSCKEGRVPSGSDPSHPRISLDALVDDFYGRVFEYRERHGENPPSLVDIGFRIENERVFWQGRFYKLEYNPESDKYFLRIYNSEGRLARVLTSGIGVLGN